ncbi:MAG: DUF2254 domain-containing protein [Chitinophagaceae bacterium]|nr:MAG: DUF2254 domain-containing protein [Chitinophagaceae bacterium]
MVNSIAFYPAFIALIFLVLSYFMVSLDFSETGKQIKAQMEWLKLKDATTARSIISVIAAGILSLTVFSFTMVMVILNQAASQMSNRVLDKLIGNRFQQIVLGFYIGTIVYSLFLLSAIRDIDSGIYVPALSTFLLIAFAIIDIFLFIYFLHYITQSVKYAVIINRIYKQTEKALKSTCRLSEEPLMVPTKDGSPVLTTKPGIFEGFNQSSLLHIAQEEDCVFSFMFTAGSYLLKGIPVLLVHPVNKALTNELKEKIIGHVLINDEESIDENFYYGFRQLTEVAVKALSPGINDPGTAVQSMRALAELLSYRVNHFPDNHIKDEQGNIRIITKEAPFENIFTACIMPIWDYGKEDRFVQQEMHHLLLQLQVQCNHPVISHLLVKVQSKISER